MGNAVEWIGIALGGIEASANGAILTTLERTLLLERMAGQLTNKQARTWYNTHKARIPSMLNKSSSLEDQARQAFSLRNHFRTEARYLMKDRTEAEYLDLVDPNLTWEQIVNLYRSQNFEGDDLWNVIIKKSTEGRMSADEAAGIKK